MVRDEAGKHVVEGYIYHAVDFNFISVDLGEPLKVFYGWKLPGQICKFKNY